jgi:hypothetical protein
MKNNKLMKLFLSFLMVLTITYTNTNLITKLDLHNYDSQVELLSDDGEDSPIGNWQKK